MSKTISPTLRQSDNPNFIAGQISATSNDIPEIASSVIQLPIIDLTVDKVSFIVLSFTIIALIILWKKLGLFSLIRDTKILLLIFIVQILFFMFQIFSSPASHADVSKETSSLIVVEQLSSVFLGSMVLFIVFSSKIQYINYRIIMVSIIINTLLFIYTSVENTGENMRILRKIKQSGLNISIFLFATACFLIVYKK